jgi:hypothetical protein
MVIQDAVQLGVGVVVLLTRVRVRRIHIGGDGVRNELAVSAVLRPRGNGVAQALADDPVEGLAVPRAVQVPEHVVQGTVLEQRHHDVIQRAGPIRCGHQPSSLPLPAVNTAGSWHLRRL